MDSSRLYFIGGLATAALAGVYIFWGPSQKSKRNKRDWVTGLENLGNTCFLNSVLQALAPCTSVTAWVAKQKSESSFLALALANVFKGLNNEDSSKSISHPAEVLSALRLRNWVITNHEQDAHELFHAFTTTLQEEQICQQNPLSLLDVRKIEEIDKMPFCGVVSRVSGPVQTSYPTGGSQWILPTKGLLACRLSCKTCGFRNPIRYDSFDSISLTLPEHFWGSLKLEQCLKQWASAELIPDVFCAGCSKQTSGTKQKSTFIKQLCFGRLPSCLCLHLMRTVWLPMGTPCKRFEHVSFPEYLNLRDYLSLPGNSKFLELSRFHSGLLGGKSQDSKSRTTTTGAPGSFQEGSVHCSQIKDSSVPFTQKSSIFNHLYQLKSVIVHLGDTFSGHFITYRRGPKYEQNTLWFCVSDMSVHQVSYLEVFKASAYMLFYEKM